MKVRDAMSRGVVSVRPETPLKEAVRLLDTNGISGLPVVDADGRVVGVLSESDLLRKAATRGEATRSRFAWLLRHVTADDTGRLADAATVRDAMTTPAVTIRPADALAAAARTMLSRGINRLPVVDGGGLVGIITRADVARSFLRPDEELEETIREAVLRRALWIDPDSISVRVIEGVAHLRGTVDRRSTTELVDRLVRRIDGIIGADVDLAFTLDDTHIRAEERDLVHREVPR